MGYYIIHKVRLYNDLLFNSDDIDLEWMLASTYHDVAYPLQNVEKWFNDLFDIFLGFEPAVHFNFFDIVPPIYIDFMKMISGHHKNSEKVAPIQEKYTNFDWVVYSKINTEFLKKNHGVMSSLMLAYNLYIVQKYAQKQTLDF